LAVGSDNKTVQLWDLGQNKVVTALTPERHRVLDAIELLEQVRTDRAIALLREIEHDALIPQIRVEARQSLQRIMGSGDEKK
jgi:hypothetical protein